MTKKLGLGFYWIKNAESPVSLRQKGKTLFVFAKLPQCHGFIDKESAV